MESLLEESNEEIAGRTIREISYLIKLGIEVGEKDLVVKYTLLLSGLNFSAPLFEEIQTKFWIMDAISVADAYTNFKIAKGAFESIKKIGRQFSEKRKGVLIYFIAKTSFLSGNLGFAKKVLAYKFDNQKVSQEQHSIFSKVISLLIMLESDDFDEIDRAIKRLRRLNEKVQSVYLESILDTLQKFTQTPIGELKSVLRLSIQNLKENPPLQPEILYFDFSIWLKSKIYSLPYKEVIEEEFSTDNSALVIGF